MLSIRLFSFLVTFLICVSTCLAADSYRLTGGETLELRAGNWDARNKTFANWDGVTGSYTVGPDGNIYLPIVGTIDVVGKSLEEIAETIAGQMQRIVGLSELPAVSIEISQYAPVFVGGAVAAPGRFEFIPGMTVEKALALAGGFYRLLQEDTGTAAGLTKISAEIDRLRQTAATLALQEARLDQEARLYASGHLPDDLEPETSDPVQAKILEANIQVIKAEIQSLKDLRILLREKISQLTDEIALRDEQIERARADLASMEHLKDRGLAVSTRVSAANASLNDLEAKRLQLEVARLDAEQRLNLALRDEDTLLDRTRAQRLSELTQVQSKRFDVESRLELARKVYSETLNTLPVESPGKANILTPSYSISRVENGETQRLSVELTDPMEPGDSLTIILIASQQVSE